MGTARWGLALICLAGFFLINAMVKPPPDEKFIENIVNYLSTTVEWQDAPAPDFTFRLLDGETFRLADHVGKKVIILNFFTTWCGPCKKEMPEFERFYNENKEKILLVGIDVDEKKSKVEEFIHELQLTFPIGISESDDSKSASYRYGVKSFPTTVVIGVDGRVALYEMGAISNAEVVFTPLIKAEEEKLAENGGIEREEFITASDKAIALMEEKAKGKTGLSDRGIKIARKMTCPCGCKDNVIDCSCSTSKAIQKDMKVMLEDEEQEKSDDEIILELNSRHCVGAKGKKNGDRT